MTPGAEGWANLTSHDHLFEGICPRSPYMPRFHSGVAGDTVWAPGFAASAPASPELGSVASAVSARAPESRTPVPSPCSAVLSFLGLLLFSHVLFLVCSITFGVVVSLQGTLIF